MPDLDIWPFINRARRSIAALLDEKSRKRTRKIYVLSVLVALGDIIGLSSMVPVLMLAIDHSFLEKSRKLRSVYNYFHFQTEGQFLMTLIVAIILFYIVKSAVALWIYRYTRKSAIEIVRSLSTRSYFRSFRNNTYAEVSNDGLGFNDAVIFTPYYYVTGVYLPLLNVITEFAVVVLLTLVFTLYNPIMLVFIIGLLGSTLWLVNRGIRNRITRLGEEGSKYRDESIGVLNFGLSGFLDIKLHNAEGYFRDKFDLAYRRFVTAGMKVMNYQQVPARLIELIALAGMVILVIYAYWFSDNLGQIRAVAALFVISIFRLIPAANRLFQAFMHIKLNAYTIDSLAKNGETGEKAAGHAVLVKELELKDLGFSYGSHEVLKNLDLLLRKGSVTGISGASGAGKTTLLRILMGFQNPQSGQILLDGKDVTEIGSISNLYAYVGQDPFVFDGNIMENVALGETPENIDMERVMDCLKQASLNLKVPEQEWPAFNVGEGGNKLSEGQKQRLCLARALYLQRPILLLDEPTSALDAETEKSIIESLDALKRSEKTILIIAHRERIFEICDAVYTLKNNHLNKIR